MSYNVVIFIQCHAKPYGLVSKNLTPQQTLKNIMLIANFAYAFSWCYRFSIKQRMHIDQWRTATKKEEQNKNLQGEK